MTVFIGIELVIALTCLITGIVSLVRGRRDRGAGLLLGWLLGVVATILVISA